MSSTSTIHAHITYELIDETEPKIVVIEFLSRAIGVPSKAHELGEQLCSLIRPDLPHQFVIDFRNVRTLGSTAFAEIVSFARDLRKVGGRLKVCGMNGLIKLGATLIGLDDLVEFADDREMAINEYLDLAERGRFISLIAHYHS